MFKVSRIGFENGKRLTIDAAKRVLMRSMFKMEEIAIDKAPVDLGGLRESITVFPQILSDQYVLRVNQSYASSLEYGSRPYYAPIKPLKDWASRKLGREEIAYAVRAKIAREGIQAQPFLRPAFFQVQNYWYPIILKEEFAKTRSNV